MVPLKPVLLASFLVCISLHAGPAKADGWFFLDPIELEAEIRFEGYQYDTRRPASDTSSVAEKRTSLLLEERLFVGMRGYLIDPRINNFTITVAPVFRQGRDSINGDGEDDMIGHHPNGKITPSSFEPS